MARTKASVGSKVASGKSSKARCSAAPPPSSTVASGSGDRSTRNNTGGNSVCPRETPKWQKPITNFFICKDTSHSSTEETPQIEQEVAAGSSKQKQKRNIILSDNEDSPEIAKVPVLDEEQIPEKAKNKVLDETIELEPLIGDDSHKIEEYYPKGAKGKGVGKKTKGKENMNSNERKSVKRDRDDKDTGVSGMDSVCKKIKVN